MGEGVVVTGVGLVGVVGVGVGVGVVTGWTAGPEGVSCDGKDGQPCRSPCGFFFFVVTTGIVIGFVGSTLVGTVGVVGSGFGGELVGFDTGSGVVGNGS